MTDILQTGFVRFTPFTNPINRLLNQLTMQSKKPFYTLSFSFALLQNSVSATVRSVPATLHKPLFLRFCNKPRYHKEPFHTQRVGDHILHSIIIFFNMIWMKAWTVPVYHYLALHCGLCVPGGLFFFMIGRCQSSIEQMELDYSITCVIDMHVH